jgi:hypothetical protein
MKCWLCKKLVAIATECGPSPNKGESGALTKKKKNRANYGIVQMPLVEVLIQKKKDKEL